MSEICKTEPKVEKEKSWSDNLDNFINWVSSCRMDQSGDIALDDKPELYKEVKKYEKFHKLGQAINEEPLPLINNVYEALGKYYVVTGSVDRTTFRAKTKRENSFYNDKVSAAINLADSWDEITIDFPSLSGQPELAQRMFDIINAIGSMEETDQTDEGFKKMLVDKGFAEEEIYGPEGALNILLAYERALISSSEWSSNSKLIKKVKISVAKEEGKKRKSRYTKVYEFLKPEEKKASVVIKPEEGEKPVVPAKAPEILSSLDNMVNQFGAVGFNVVWKPGAMDNMSGYSQYGKHRVSFACNSDGTYSFKVLTMPAGRDEIKGDKVTALAAKAQLDAIAQNSDVDILKAAELDLSKAVFRDFQGKICNLKVEKKNGDEYHVTIMGYRFKTHKGVVVGPKDVTFEVNIEKVNNSNVLYKGYDPKKIPLPENADLNDFLKNAASSSMVAMME